jgi:hypothetical protein
VLLRASILSSSVLGYLRTPGSELCFNFIIGQAFASSHRNSLFGHFNFLDVDTDEVYTSSVPMLIQAADWRRMAAKLFQNLTNFPLQCHIDS